MINVEVCYLTEKEQKLISVSVPEGSTVIRAILASGMLDEFPELELKNNVGIFSNRVSLDETLVEGDRVEIYRPLTLSPNELRLRRAK